MSVWLLVVYERLLLLLLLLLPLLLTYLTLPRQCYSWPDLFGSARACAFCILTPIAIANSPTTRMCIMCIHTPIDGAQRILDARKHRAQYLSKASRGKLDTRSAVQLRVPRQARVANAVVLQVGEGNVAVERTEQVLRCHAVTRLVEENRHKLVGPVLIGRLL